MESGHQEVPKQRVIDIEMANARLCIDVRCDNASMPCACTVLYTRKRLLHARIRDVHVANADATSMLLGSLTLALESVSSACATEYWQALMSGH